jgi:hypothetical protein
MQACSPDRHRNAQTLTVTPLPNLSGGNLHLEQSLAWSNLSTRLARNARPVGKRVRKLHASGRDA